jgi:hypothetical protein
LRAQLSPNELATLKRLASGDDQDHLGVPDLTQLVALRLIESRNGVWHLSKMGLMRLAGDRARADQA